MHAWLSWASGRVGGISGNPFSGGEAYAVDGYPECASCDACGAAVFWQPSALSGSLSRCVPGNVRPARNYPPGAPNGRRLNRPETTVGDLTALRVGRTGCCRGIQVIPVRLLPAYQAPAKVRPEAHAKHLQKKPAKTRAKAGLRPD